jgi:hypothetical protein
MGLYTQISLLGKMSEMGFCTSYPLDVRHLNRKFDSP